MEFGLHPRIYCEKHDIPYSRLPITTQKIWASIDISNLDVGKNFSQSNNILLTSDEIQTNRCLISRNSEQNRLMLAELTSLSDKSAEVEISLLHSSPFAIFECKRVGVEEGAKKGPTTIEKAKQGAYVAKHVSSLQKIRDVQGNLVGAFAKPEGGFDFKPYDEAIQWMIHEAPLEYLGDFILTIGIASNHGNWFTSKNPNKELLVLKQSYDWLLFLSDAGLTKFIQDLILPDSNNQPVRTAFLASYDTPKTSKRKNQLTKVRLLRSAHLAICDYFNENITEIESWFEVLSPAGQTLKNLKEQLHTLAQKNWQP